MAEQNADRRGAFAERGDAGTLGIVDGQLRAPGGIGQRSPSEADRNQRGPESEVAEAGLLGRPEEHEGGKRGERERDQEEAAPTAAAPAPSVGEPAEHRIGRRIEHADGDENGADGCNRQPDRLRIEGRDDDIERQGQGCKRQGGQRVGDVDESRHGGRHWLAVLAEVGRVSHRLSAS